MQIFLFFEEIWERVPRHSKVLISSIKSAAHNKPLEYRASDFFIIVCVGLFHCCPEGFGSLLLDALSQKASVWGI